MPQSHDAERASAITRHIIESIPGAFYMLDSQGKYVRWNAFQRDVIVGETDEGMAVFNAIETFHPDDREAALAGIQQIMLTGEEDIAERRVLLHGGPDYLWLLMTGHRVIIDGEPFIIGTGVDITARKKAEEDAARLEQQLLQSQKMEVVGKLAGGIAHDFNNMLAVILGHAEMLSDGMGPEDERYGNLEAILGATQRLDNLTRQLLAFARSQVVLPKVLDFDESVDGTLGLLRRLIGENIELRWLPGADGGRVKIDPSQIDQIIANLFVNARDAISGSGTITIETRRFTQPEKDVSAGVMERKPGSYLSLSVTDTGKGMSPEMIHRIFEPFYTTKDIGKGTGLGLSTVYGIVRQNGGFLDVSSEPEKGSRFTVCIPECTVAANTQTHSAVSHQKSSEGGGKVVLVVEDEADILRLCAFVLRGEGFTVLTASSPSEALEVARRHAAGIDLLLTDVIMPAMNGGDLHRALLETHPALRAVFMSGYTADIIGEKGVAGEGLNFLQKPFSVRNLTGKVQEVLDLPSPLQ